jgi:hypothetical protein
MYPIATTTASSGSVSSITFSSIPQNFTHLQLRVFTRSNRNYSGNTVDGLNLYVNGSVYFADSHDLSGSGSSATSGYNNAGLGFFPDDGGAPSNIFGSFIFDILDYTNTNKNKVIKGIGGFDTNGVNGGGYVQLTSNLLTTTSAITSMTFYWLFGGTVFDQYSTFSLYGITTA